MTQNMSKAQQIMSDLLREGSFNGLDGPKVADSLLAHRGWWKGFIFFQVHGLGITLRDIGQLMNADTLWIMPTVAGLDDGLETLAKSWGADEVGWIDDSSAGEVLRVWWD